MSKVLEKQRKRIKRKISIRKKITGTPERPRMSIYKSNKYIYVQVIDDIAGNTLVSVNNMQKEFSSIKSNVAEASKLGKAIAKKLTEKKISTVVFDRNGFAFHGVVKAVADGAREAGIKF